MQKQQLTNSYNYSKLSNLLSRKINNGFKILERNDTIPYVVLHKEQKDINHAFNFFLCCITLGIWSVIWIYQYVTYSKTQEIILALDEDGNVFEEKCYTK